jgi:hypothetical protein
MKKSTIQPKRTNRLKINAKRLAAYSAAAAATAATTGTANAAEKIWDIPDITFDSSSLNINLKTGNVSTVSSFFFYSGGRAPSASGVFPINFAEFKTSSYANPYLYQNGTTNLSDPTGDPWAGIALIPGGGFQHAAARLDHGDSVGPFAQTFSDGVNAVYGSSHFFKAASNADWYYLNPTGFIGLSFSISGVQHFGWLEITRNPSGDELNSDATLHGFGYQTVAGIESITPSAADSTVDPIAGDGNGDGKVDGLDYLLWAGAFGDDPAADPPGSPENGDYDGNGVVDGIDYLTWAGNFGNGPNDGSAVPEPSSMLLLAAGAAGMAGWRRRRSA